MGLARDMAQQSMALTEARTVRGGWHCSPTTGWSRTRWAPRCSTPTARATAGKEAITAFYDNVIMTSEKIEFTIRDSYECGSEVANVGQIKITLPGNQVGIVPIVNIYKVNDAGQLLSLRSFWEADELSFSQG